jgi:hypothetical protein
VSDAVAEGQQTKEINGTVRRARVVESTGEESDDEEETQDAAQTFTAELSADDLADKEVTFEC